MIYEVFVIILQRALNNQGSQIVEYKKQITMKKYYCTVCHWEYDPAIGDPEQGIEPGTAFEDIPEDWVCPMCGVGKEEFAPVEE